MKISFMRLLTAGAEGAAGATGTADGAAIVEPTSAKLTELKAAGKTLKTAMDATEFGTPEFQNAMDALLNNRKEQAAEIAGIKKAEADEKLAVLRSERTKTIDAYKAAVLANVGKLSTDETKAAEQAAYDVLVNLVLPNHATKAAPAATSGTGTKGNKTAEIVAELTRRINGGMSPSDAVKEVIALGYSRGTVGTERTKYWPAK